MHASGMGDNGIRYYFTLSDGLIFPDYVRFPPPGNGPCGGKLVVLEPLESGAVVVSP